VKTRLEVPARERLHPQGHQTGEHSADAGGQAVENRRFRGRVPRVRRSAVRGVRGHALVPAARVRVDVRMVRHENGHLGRGLRAVRDGHQPTAVRRQGQGRPDGQDRTGVGLAELSADQPVPEAQVGPVGRAPRDGRTGDARGRRAARGVPAVPARVRAAQGDDRVRPDQAVLGRPAVAQTVLPRDEGHRVRAHGQAVRDEA